MIKFILAIVAMIFVGLAAYVYMNPKETHVPVAKVVHKTEKSIVKKEARSVQKETISATVEVVSEKKDIVSEKLDSRVIIPAESKEHTNGVNLIKSSISIFSEEEIGTEKGIEDFENEIAQAFADSSKNPDITYDENDFLDSEDSSDNSTNMGNQDEEDNQYTEEISD